MLKLKRIELQGFKSFYERTEMKFHGSGIAAIVGPNGCGKSNLSDAISWVLGEQSAKTLRGTRMEDVIFAGTRERKPLGMASVSLTLMPDEEAGTLLALSDAAVPANGRNGHALRRTDAAKAAEHSGEITITRRLYRSGESEYLLNGKLARLRDIQDLFFGTGLGPESYAIIEQGRIGQILSSRPQDRRNVIEEAAGVTKFKTRKRLAEAKLESAKQNLARVFDILEEVTRQVNSLKRQAAKTKRYAELKAEATKYLQHVLGAKAAMLEREIAKVAIELNLASAELQKAHAAIAEREAEQTAVLEASYATEQELIRARERLAGLHLELERARGRAGYQSKQIEQIDDRLQAGRQEMQALEDQRKERTAEFERQTTEWQALERQCGEVRQQLAAKSAERQKGQLRLTEEESTLETARQNVLRWLGESASLKNRITQVEAQLIAMDRDSARAQMEERQSETDLERVRQAKAQVSEELTARQSELVQVSQQRNIVEQHLHEIRARLNESRQAAERLEREFSRIKARRESLEEILQDRSYTTETVKRLFRAVEHGRARDLHPLGVLADFLEVDPQLEKAAEEFLHDELEYVVVRDWAQAERGIDLMRADLNGRATFLVKAETAVEAAGDLPQPSVENAAITKLTDALRLTSGLSNLPLDRLPRIANCYVTSDRTLAQQLAAVYPHCWFLLTDGVSYHGPVVSGGKKSSAGPLALKRELREVSKVEESKQVELRSALANLAELEGAISERAADLENLRNRQQIHERAVIAMDHESRKLAEEAQRIQARFSVAHLQFEQLARDRKALEEEAERDRVRLTECGQATEAEERRLEASRKELTVLQLEAARAAEEHAGLRASLASLEERQRSLADHRARIQSEIQEVVERRARLSEELETLTGERTRLIMSNAELESQAAQLERSISETDGTVDELAQREAELRSRLAVTEEDLKRLRMDAQAAQERRADLQVALARAESDLKHLEQTCENELGATLPQLLEGMETVADARTLEELENKYSEVRRKIEALGPVNPEALQEFEEAQERQKFLNTQRQDLLDSIRDTEKTIHEIDSESKKRFTEAFHAINANFRELFGILFGGGAAEMRLTDEENLAESGIDIVASPPGKKLQSVLLLSGGEKALTAMALLMATFQYTPSPFCVLDEVDAPLDEPNIERLTRLLREMSGQTQFLVITHAKRTMEAAQALYGITMQEAGVSKLVSVKFDDPVIEENQRRRRAVSPVSIALR